MWWLPPTPFPTLYYIMPYPLPKDGWSKGVCNHFIHICEHDACVGLWLLNLWWTFLRVIKSCMYTVHVAGTHVSTTQPYHNKKKIPATSCAEMLFRHPRWWNHGYLSGSPAAYSNKGSCPCIILAFLLVTYPDFHKWWPPTPQCAFNFVCNLRICSN